MTEKQKRIRSVALSVAELILLGLVLAGCEQAFEFWKVNGRLPQPFIFDTYDTFMDWFNTAYWAHNRGEYAVWRSVYPPLSFVFLRFAGFSDCYAVSPVTARDCDSLGISVILVAYVVCIGVVAISFWRNDRRSAIMRTIAVAFGLPLLFTLERGNLIIIAFPFFALAHGPVVIPRVWRAAAMAVTINFKPYLLIPGVAWAVGRRWTTMELVGIATVLIYLITYGLNGDGSITTLIDNTKNFIEFQGGLIYEALYYSTSYAPFLNFDTYLFPTRDFVPTAIVDAISFYVPILIRLTQAVVALCVFGAYLQPKVLSHQRLAALLLGAYLVTSSPGGYAALFLVFLVFLEKAHRVGVYIAVAVAYLVSIPYDKAVGELFAVTNQAWLANRDVTESFGVSLGLFVRPFGNIVIVWALAFDGLYQIVLAHRHRRPTVDPHPSASLPVVGRV